jgi:hypothetical protein
MEMDAELAKYEAELAEVGKRLSGIDEQRSQVIRIGMRLEGVVAYLRGKKQNALATDAIAHAAQAKLEEKQAEVVQDSSAA